jgi:L-rhamnose mutarotase
MILVQIHQFSTSKILLQSAARLAGQLGKSFAVLIVADDENELTKLLNECKIYDYKIFIIDNSKSLVEVCEANETSFSFIQLSDNKLIRKQLNECHDLRIPYLFYKNSFGELDLKKVILPIGFLEEELEKAQFAAAFGRFCSSEVKMLLANDYGSKAAKNAEKMIELFEKFDFKYTLEKATKDSFKVEAASIQVAESEGGGIIIISASRDYGLDDILFGPKEYHIIRKSSVPVLLVNPRGDLYALCD